MHDYDIRVEENTFSLSETQEYGFGCVRRMYFTLLYSPWDEEERAEPVEVGSFESYIFQASEALNRGCRLVECADEIDQDIYDAAEVCYGQYDPEDDDNIASSLEEEGFFNADVLLLNRIFIDPKHRGKGMGARFLDGVLRYLGTANIGAVVVRPTAGCYFENEKLSDDPYCERALSESGNERLCKWYESLGFKPWKHTGYYFINLELRNSLSVLHSKARRHEEGWAPCPQQN